MLFNHADLRCQVFLLYSIEKALPHRLDVLHQAICIPYFRFLLYKVLARHSMLEGLFSEERRLARASDCAESFFLRDPERPTHILLFHEQCVYVSQRLFSSAIVFQYLKDALIVEDADH